MIWREVVYMGVLGTLSRRLEAVVLSRVVAVLCCAEGWLD